MNAKKLKGKMAEAGVSQRRLAEMTGMNKNTLTSRLLGRTSFTLPEAEAICNALGITSHEEMILIFLPGCPKSGSVA